MTATKLVESEDGAGESAPHRLSTLPEAPEHWHLRLYVAGQSPRSLKAMANLSRLCEEYLAGHYEIEIVDLVDNPSLAQRDDILAIPTLIRRLPSPTRKIIGDLSDTKRVLIGLQVNHTVLGPVDAKAGQ